MKLFALILGSSLLSAIDPGCGAAAGADVAQGPATAPDGGTEGTGAWSAGSGSPSTVSCGALGAHFFCDDFGEGALPGGFDDEASSAGTLALDGKLATSGPSSLFASTQHVTSSTRTFARLEKAFALPANHFTLAYAQYVDPSCVGPSDSVETAVIGLKSNTYWVAVRYASTDQILETTVDHGLYTQAHELREQMPRGQWVRVSLDVDLAQRTIGFSVDGAQVVAGEPLKYPPGASLAPNIAVGSLTDNLSFQPSACEVHIDDVTFDVSP